MQTISPLRSALYYPFPFINDESWLKSATLFWDHLYRIIPSRFSQMVKGDSLISEPSESEKFVREEFGFIYDYVIPPLGFGQAATSAVQALLRMMDLFPEYFSSQMQSGEDYFSWGELELLKGGVHTAIYTLQERGAVDYGPRGLRFKEFPGRVYMALLARYISEEYNLPLVTDDLKHDLILKSYLLTFDGEQFSGENNLQAPDTPGIKRRQKTLGTVLCNLTFEAIGIRNLSKVSIEQIGKIRRNYDSERKAFVDEVQKYVSDLQQEEIRNETQIETYLKDRATKLEQQRRNYEKAIKGIGIETTFDLAKVTTMLPIVGTIAKHLTLTEPICIVLSGSLGIGAAFFKRHQSKRREMIGNPVPTYLFQLSKNLNRDRYFQRVGDEISKILKNKVI